MSGLDVLGGVRAGALVVILPVKCDDVGDVSLGADGLALWV